MQEENESSFFDDLLKEDVAGVDPKPIEEKPKEEEKPKAEEPAKPDGKAAALAKERGRRKAAEAKLKETEAKLKEAQGKGVTPPDEDGDGDDDAAEPAHDRASIVDEAVTRIRKDSWDRSLADAVRATGVTRRQEAEELFRQANALPDGIKTGDPAKDVRLAGMLMVERRRMDEGFSPPMSGSTIGGGAHLAGPDRQMKEQVEQGAKVGLSDEDIKKYSKVRNVF